jgi:eukaryotic-like serine/threonine-protein kinase
MPLEGQLLGYYRLQRLIGSGGMGEIYVAEDTHIPRNVAVKVIRAEKSLYNDDQTVQETERLFQREMQAISQLDHPHILPIFDYGVDQVNGVTYMVMPYRPEGSLLDYLVKRGNNAPLTPRELLPILLQAADALQHAHDRQIVHQDIKPSNFLMRVRNSEALLPDVLLADFGIAKFLNTSTSTLNVRGTPTYMSPEQWDGRPVFASDQYSLAVMTFQLLTGQPPFRGAAGQIMHMHFHMPPPVPSSLNPQLSPAIDAVLLRALAKRPEERFPSVFQFAQAFEQALNAETVLPVQQQSSPFQQQSLANAAPPTLIEAQPTFVATTTPQSNAPVSGTAYSPQRNQAPTVLSGGERVLAESRSAMLADYKAPPPPQRSSFLNVFLVVIIALVILGSAGGLLFAYKSGFIGARAKATASGPGALPASQPTATAPAIATIPSQPPQDTSSPYYSDESQLLLSDPLSGPKTTWKNNTAPDWGGTCIFENGAYHIIQNLGPDRAYSCDAGSKLQSSNFVYQVQMTVLQGTCGGIVFRYSSITHYGYRLRMCSNGAVQLSNDSSTGTNVLFDRVTLAIHRGLNQSNTLAVVAKAHGVEVYINDKLINRAVIAISDVNMFALFSFYANEPTEVAFRNVKIWKVL